MTKVVRFLATFLSSGAVALPSAANSTNVVGPGPNIVGRTPPTAQMLRVAALAPPLNTLKFGSGVEVHTFKPSWTLEEAWAKGRLMYVLYQPAGHYSRERLGILSHGLIRDISLPGTFVGLGIFGGQPFITGTTVEGQVEYFRLSGTMVTKTSDPHLSAEARAPPYTLTDGDSCQVGGPNDGTAILAVDSSHKVRSVLSTEGLRAATGDILETPYTVRCNHFDNKNFATIGSGVLVVLQLSNRGAELLTSGQVLAADDRLILIQANNGELLEAQAP